MQEYLFQAGKHNAKPYEPWWPIWNPRGFEIEFVLDKSCWFPLEEWEGDEDWFDWNFKIAGLTGAFSRNNYRAAMIAARPAHEQDTFLVTAYTNDKKGGWETGEETAQIGVVELEAGEVGKASAKIHRKRGGAEVRYTLQGGGNTIQVTHDFDKPWLNIYRQIGSWFGGADSDGDGIGGVPHKPMKLFYGIRFL